MSVRLVLDTTALLGYVAPDVRAIHVAELVAVAKEGGESVGIPALSLVVACELVGRDEKARLLALCRTEQVVVLDLLGEDAADLMDLAGQVGGADRAQSAAAVRRHDALLATYEREPYGLAIDDEQVIDMRKEL